jgi:hypothetical protein
MSIVESLKKLVDPVKARQEEEERRKDREQPIRSDAGAGPERECRVCGYRSTDLYCPTCLAETMQLIPRRK